VKYNEHALDSAGGLSCHLGLGEYELLHSHSRVRLVCSSPKACLSLPGSSSHFIQELPKLLHTRRSFVQSIRPDTRLEIKD
jgi:hypothetical protein